MKFVVTNDGGLVNIMLLESAAAVLFILFIVTTLIMVGLCCKIHQQLRTLRCVENELGGLLACSEELSRKMQRYQRLLYNIRYRQDYLAAKESDGLGRRMNLLLSKGFTEDEIVSICELSRSEISMFTDLQKAKRDAHNTSLDQT